MRMTLIICVSQPERTNERVRNYIAFRALAAFELNSYNAILAPPKYQKQPCSSRGMVIIFS